MTVWLATLILSNLMGWDVLINPGELHPSLLEKTKNFQEEKEKFLEKLTDYELVLDSE